VIILEFCVLFAAYKYPHHQKNSQYLSFVHKTNNHEDYILLPKDQLLNFFNNTSTNTQSDQAFFDVDIHVKKSDVHMFCSKKSLGSKQSSTQVIHKTARRKIHKGSSNTNVFIGISVMQFYFYQNN
jgi:hypothetical protein